MTLPEEKDTEIHRRRRRSIPRRDQPPRGDRRPPPERNAEGAHEGAIVWLTGLPGSGKVVLSRMVEERLLAEGCRCRVLRAEPSCQVRGRDSAARPRDHGEAARRVGETAKRLAERGAIVLVVSGAPLRDDRERVRARVARPRDFIEVFVSCPPEVCEARDPTGVWARAREGEIRAFPGVHLPFEPPEAPELVVKTNLYEMEECARQVVQYLRECAYLEGPPARRRAAGS